MDYQNKWMIRISEVTREKLTEMLERFSNDALIIVCAEGEPYDKDVRSHVHMYLVCKHSESWLRKQIQKLDERRKSNELYSMKKAHEQSPNYVLKNYYKENENRSRIWFQRNCDMDLLLTWKKQHEAYMAEVKVAKKIRSSSKKSFSKLLVEEATEQFSDFSPSHEELIRFVINYYKSQKTMLPTRNQMESLILNIRSSLGNDEYVMSYYQNSFSQY